MDEIIKQELFRSAGVFWFALILSLLITKELEIINGFVLLEMAFILTLITSLTLIIIRKKLHRGEEIILLAFGFLSINLGILISFLGKSSTINMVLIIGGITSFTYGLVRLFKNKEKN